MSLYVYCLGDGLTEAALAGVRGLNDEPARLFGHAGLVAVVSPFGEAPVPVTRAHLLAHNRVNAQALASATPLPFRFGTLTTEERLASYMGARAAGLRAALARVRDCVEMSVKLMRETTAEAPAAPPADAGTAPAGTAFLLAKRRELLGEERERRRAEELAAWLERRTSDLARESEVRVCPSESIVVRAAHLVVRARLADYRERLRALRAERPDLRFLNSGPWPPYSFADADVTASGCE